MQLGIREANGPAGGAGELQEGTEVIVGSAGNGAKETPPFRMRGFF